MADILIAAAISTAINLAITVATNMLSDPIEGPRLTDLSVQTSTYGTPIPKIYGERARVAGNVIWSTGLIETRHKKGGFLTPKVVTYSYRTSVAVALCERTMEEGPIHGVPKCWANGKVIFNAARATTGPDEEAEGSGSVWLRVFARITRAHGLLQSLSVYNGSFEQLPDPTIEADKGAGFVSAYRGIAYVVLKDLQLADFGNRLPQLQFLVEAKLGQSVASVLNSITGAGGVDAKRQISTTAMTSTVCGGYVVARETSCWAAIAPLQTAYDFDPAEQNGQLRFVRRGRAMQAVIPLADLAARAPGEERPPSNAFRDEGEKSLPREVTVRFLDPNRDYQQNAQVDRRQEGNTDSNITVDLPISLPASEGRAIASRVLWGSHIGRKGDRFVLTDKWRHVWPGRVYGLETPSGVRPFFIQHRLRGANGLVEVEAKADESVIYTFTPPGVEAEVPDNDLLLPGDTTLIMLDIPILQDADDDEGFYIVADGGEGWRGALVQRSTDGGTTFQDVYDASTLAITGEVDGVVGDGPEGVFDDETRIIVRLTNPDDELETISDDELYAGANRCWIGDAATGQDGEILQFGVATIISEGVYELSHLIRGALGTDYAIGAHGGYETFVLLERENLERVNYGSADWNIERTYRGWSVLTEEDEAISRTFTNSGEGKRPLSPVNVVAERDNYDDLTVGWQRRSRLTSLDPWADPPLGEEEEAYEVDVWAGGVVVDTLSVGPERSILLTAADQIGYGITPGDEVTLDIYQMSATRGRGRPRRAVV